MWIEASGVNGAAQPGSDLAVPRDSRPFLLPALKTVLCDSPLFNTRSEKR